MRLPTASPERFVAEFNAAVLGSYRKLTAEDVRDMTDCGLIGKYGYYCRADLEIVRTVLEYERLRQNRQKRDEIRDNDGAIHCRQCGALLTQSDNKRGRPKEYCAQCEPLRGSGRWRKWRQNKEVL